MADSLNPPRMRHFKLKCPYPSPHGYFSPPRVNAVSATTAAEVIACLYLLLLIFFPPVSDADKFKTSTIFSASSFYTVLT